MTWKELAIGLADSKAHAMYCPFRGCMCGAVEHQIEWLALIQAKRREERKV